MANSASSSSSSASAPWSSYVKDLEEINQDGKILIKLSDRKPLFIVPDIFREKVYINIREYYIRKSESEEEEEEEEGEGEGEEAEGAEEEEEEEAGEGGGGEQ